MESGVPRRHDDTRGLAGTRPSCSARLRHGSRVASLFAMNSRFLAFVSLLIASFLLAPSLRAQDTDKEVDDSIQQATEVAKKMGVKMPDVKKQLDEVNKKEAKEKAVLQRQLEAPRPLALPDWTPKAPQFEPTGPVSRKIVSDEVNIIQTGTSPLTPAELGNSWEEAPKGDKLNSSRTNGSYNDTKVVTIYLSTRQEPLQSVVLEARRAPEDKITHVTISPPPKPVIEEE